MKLNLGAGDIPLDGHENLDRKNGQEIYPLDVPDGSCDEIRASHVLEHFGRAEVPQVVNHWVQKLKVGGVLKIAVPDFKKVASNYLDGKEEPTAGYVMGGQTDENDFHRSLFDEELLRRVMTEAGITDITTWESEAKDCASLPISLNLQGTKGATKRVNVDMSKVHAVISVPRLAFTDNMHCAMQAILPLGCQFRKGTGVFWDQILTRLIEEAISEGAEYILTIDYDTWFKREHVVALMRLALMKPDAAAFVPMQVKREADGVLAGFHDRTTGMIKDQETFPINTDIVPIATGHFGLTLIRASVFEKLEKPWFQPRPGPDGRWGEGRTDSDISFWQRVEAAGLQVYLCPQINIGHYQLVCSFPPPLGSPDYKTVHVYSSKLTTRELPSHIIPKVKECA
ncbi:MAG: hypothetical protein PHU85_13720 [Phycisphaerae bacterium]|nr:hypothetical protein [Phycisphaerae bacterium]